MSTSVQIFYPRPVVASLKELWRPVTGLKRDFSNCYEVSNFGRVRRIGRKILKPAFNKDGYKFVGLCKNNKVYRRYIHQLVMYAWNEPCPGTYGFNEGEYLIDHHNTDIWDNSSHNLRWLLSAANSSKPGESNSQAILTEKEVIEIRNSTLPWEELCNKYSMSLSAIRHIVYGRNWIHIPYLNKEEVIRRRALKVEHRFTKNELVTIANDTRTIKEICKEYGISKPTLSKIRCMYIH